MKQWLQRKNLWKRNTKNNREEFKMKVIEGLYYSEDHEWVRAEGNKAYIGITDHAQHELGDIVFVELPEMDEEVEKNEAIGVIESVKAASDMNTPISGTVIEINEELEDSPELLNEDPYENFITVLEIKDKSDLDDLMDSEAYKEFCENN